MGFPLVRGQGRVGGRLVDRMVGRREPPNRSGTSFAAPGIGWVKYGITVLFVFGASAAAPAGAFVVLPSVAVVRSPCLPMLMGCAGVEKLGGKIGGGGKGGGGMMVGGAVGIRMSAGAAGGRGGSPPPSPQLKSLNDDGDDSSVHVVTRAWVDEWVMGLHLCPWAKLTKGRRSSQGEDGGPYTEILVVRGGEDMMEQHVDQVVREAELLGQRVVRQGGASSFSSQSSPPGVFTTLLVFPDAAYLGRGPQNRSTGAFPMLVRQVQARLRAGSGVGGGGGGDGSSGVDHAVDLLAFHRWRVDEGPGTSSDPEDAAHFSVRSPYPTLQLLSECDLHWARSQWQQQQRRRTDGRGKHLPGALGLLMQNKEVLRARGSAALAALMDSLLMK